MKKLAFLLALLLVLGCLNGCGSSVPEAPAPATEAPAPATEAPAPATEAPAPATEAPAPATEAPAPATEAPAPATEAPAPAADSSASATEAPTPADESVYVEDFTVQTADGGTFTLSEALKDHDLVLINIFATWCGPCAWEFPYLQEAWEQNADKVAVIALSIEPTDTDEVLRNYAKDMGLTFPMANIESTDLARFSPGYIPVTVLVDRNCRVAATEGGAQSSTQAFLDLFDRYAGPNYDPRVCSYSVVTFDENYEAISGVTITFCTDAACTPVTTDEEGLAVFTGAPARYHAQVVTIPEGYELVDPAEFETEPYSQNFSLMLRKIG